MITLYKRIAEIRDISGKIKGYETKAVTFPDTFFQYSGLVFDFDNNLVTYKGEYYYMDKLSLSDNTETKLPTTQEWKSTYGNSIEYKYYAGLSTETSANPSGNTNNIKRIIYKSGTLEKYIIEYTYDINDNVLTCTSIAPSSEQEESSTYLYYGALSYSDIDSETIKSLNKFTGTLEDYQLVGLNLQIPSGQCIIYAYPKSYGNLLAIYNHNLSDKITSFEVKELVISSVDYYVYIFENDEEFEDVNYSFLMPKINSKIVANSYLVNNYSFSVADNEVTLAATENVYLLTRVSNGVYLNGAFPIPTGIEGLSVSKIHIEIGNPNFKFKYCIFGDGTATESDWVTGAVDLKTADFATCNRFFVEVSSDGTAVPTSPDNLQAVISFI